MKQKIITSYETYFVANNQAPTIKELMESIEAKAEDFKKHFKNLGEVEREIWKTLVHTVIKNTQKECEDNSYSARETLLSYYYNLIEQLKPRQNYIDYSFCVQRYRNFDKAKARKVIFQDFKKQHIHFIQETLNAGFATEEFVNGKPFVQRLAQKSWYKTLLLIKVWSTDPSDEKQTTDQLIENIVHTNSDFLSNNVFNTSFSLIKFIASKVVPSYIKMAREKSSCSKKHNCNCCSSN